MLREMECWSWSSNTLWTIHRGLWKLLSWIGCFIAKSRIKVILGFSYLLWLIFQMFDFLNFLWRHVFLEGILMRIFQFIHLIISLLFRMKNLAVNYGLILNLIGFIRKHDRFCLLVIRLLFFELMLFLWFFMNYSCYTVFI